MTALRIGSLFSGAGMLDEGVRAVVGGDIAWHAEVDPAACRVLAHRYPRVPNLGDVTAVDWAAVEPVTVLTAGYPCQPFSDAGQRKAEDDSRYLWPEVARAIREVGPRLVVLENVRGHLVRGFARVVGELSELGYDAQWTTVRASDVGAPHRRERLFVLAWPAGNPAQFTCDDLINDGAGAANREVGRGRRPLGAADRKPVADADGAGLEGRGLRGSGRPRQRPTRPSRTQPAPDADDGQQNLAAGADGTADERTAARRTELRPRGRAAADASGDGWDERRPQPARLIRRPDAPISSASATDADQQRPRHIEPGDHGVRKSDQDGHRTAWGPYEPAICRWQRVLGRPAPAPTETAPRGGQRLSPIFVEWLMGWPAGWVTDVPGITRNDQLKICGNGVVPQQVAAALRLMLAAQECAA